MILEARPAAYPTRRYNRRPMTTVPSPAAPRDAFLDRNDDACAPGAWRSRLHGPPAKGHSLRAAGTSRETTDARARAPGTDVARPVQGFQDAYNPLQGRERRWT